MNALRWLPILAMASLLLGPALAAAQAATPIVPGSPVPGAAQAPIDLGVLPGGGLAISEAQGINASGQIVGTAWTAAGMKQHAVWWDKGQLTDLGTLPGGDASLALGVNAAGQIVGGSNTPA